MDNKKVGRFLGHRIDTPGKLVSSVYDKQQTCVYLRPFSCQIGHC